MADLVHMAEYKAKPGFVRFEQGEFSQILMLYSRQVALGRWHDYAIDLKADQAVFSVYRHSRERPLYAIVKDLRSQSWAVRAAGREVARSRSLSDLLSALGGSPQLVR